MDIFKLFLERIELTNIHLYLNGHISTNHREIITQVCFLALHCTHPIEMEH